MDRHLFRIGAITLLICLCIMYPFLPGEYDPLALPLSTMAQALGMFGLLLVPVGGSWLIYELRRRARIQQNLPAKARGYYFALASVIAASLVAVAVSLVGIASAGPSLGLLSLALWFYILRRLLPGLRLMKNAESEKLNAVPLYLIFIPVVASIFQLIAAAPATQLSRNHAIANSAEFIADIEAYHQVHGRYPSFLLATWKDYNPSVVGIERYHYTPRGQAYNLYFEQPRFLFDNIGTREFVVYNKLDEHFIVSHTAWILQLRPDELESMQGWYDVHDAASPHWKYFWFD